MSAYGKGVYTPTMKTADWFENIAKWLRTLEEFPYGEEADGRTRTTASTALLALCKGDEEKARALWKLIMRDCGGYMPYAACAAVIRFTQTMNLVPDIEAPDPS